MTGRKLRSRSCSVESRAGSTQGNLEVSNPTEFNQEGGAMATEIQESEILTSNPDCESANNENATVNPNSTGQSNNISQDHLKDILNTVMQAIRAESAKQISALQEESKKQTAESTKQISALQDESKKQTAESKKQTALLKAESAKLTSAVENLRSEIKKENENLAKSLTKIFEAAHDKIREDFEARLNSEVVIVSERIDNVRKDMSTTIDEVYASVSEKINTEVTQTREEIRGYIDDKFKSNADEILKVNATLEDLQNKLAVGISNTMQPAVSGNAIVRVNTADQQLATGSNIDNNITPTTNGVSLNSNPACNDSTSVVSQSTNSGMSNNVNVTSDVPTRNVDLSELTLPSFTDSSKQYRYILSAI